MTTKENRYLRNTRLFVMISIISMMLIGLMAHCSDAAELSLNKQIVGYFVEWGVYGRDYHVSNIPAEKLTHINYAFAKVENGEVAVWDTYAALEKFYPETDSWNDPPGTIRGNFNQLRILKQTYPHLKVLISVGGWTGSGAFSDVAATTEGRHRFAQSARRLIETYGFDGVDIDWEYPVCSGLQAGRPEDAENFSKLLWELRETLGEDYLLTIACSANPDCLDPLPIEGFASCLDWINIMSYDYHGAWEAYSGTTGHNAPLYNNNDPLSPDLNVDAAVSYLLDRGVPADKIVPGLAFYGRSAAGVEGIDGLYAPFTGAGPGSFEDGMLDYRDIQQNYRYTDGYTYFWDDVAAVPYLFNATQKEFISFDDERSIETKASYVAARGLGGVMFWELSGDNGDLIHAIWEGFGNPVIPVPTYACSDGIDNDNDGLIDYPNDPGCSCPEDTDETDLPAPPPTADITVTVAIGSDWQTGYCATVTVTNNGNQQVAWEVEFDVVGTISSLWSAEYTRNGDTVTAWGVSWNRTLPPGASTTFGFCAERNQPVCFQCSDGVDNDGDGLIDYPDDPGCSSFKDDDETDPVSPPGGIETETTVTSDWGSGYCADVAITNTGHSAVDWSAELEVGGTISSLWNACYSQSGHRLSVEGLDWNNLIGAKQTLTIGFCAAR